MGLVDRRQINNSLSFDAENEIFFFNIPKISQSLLLEYSKFSTVFFPVHMNLLPSYFIFFDGNKKKHYKFSFSRRITSRITAHLHAEIYVWFRALILSLRSLTWVILYR